MIKTRDRDRPFQRPKRRQAAFPPILLATLLSLGSLGLAAVVPAGAQPATAQAQYEMGIFEDGLASGFADWSWADVDLDNTETVTSGTSIRVDLAPWEALSLGNSATFFAPGDAALNFDVHGGDNSTVVLRVVAMNDSFGPGLPVTVEAVGGQWSSYSIPLRDLGGSTQLGGFWWQEGAGLDRSPIFVDNVRVVSGPTPQPTPEPEPEPQAWAFEETFDGDPTAPSQDLLPRTFEYAVTHRSHPKEHFESFGPYPADHSASCAGPNPAVSPLPQHQVFTSQLSTSSNPDNSFFVCKNHMMSSMGNVAPYSVTSFWPRQEFNFADGGVLEFDVNINDAHGNRSWWEVMIAPREELKIGAGPQDSPISETYSRNRIVLDFRRNVRTIKVGTGELAPAGWLVNETQWGQYDFAWWRDLHPNDPGLDDRRIRRTMRIQLDDDQLVWGIETSDGSFDEWRVDVPGGMPFDQGLVLFKTHAYTAPKEGNFDTYTFHWDNIRFDGPVLTPYRSHEASDVVYLQRNGDRPIGDTQTVTVELPSNPDSPVLFGQLHQPMRGQVLLSINGGPNIEVSPDSYDRNDCISDDWKSFRVELNPTWLQPGRNTFTWTVGPRPANCAIGPYNWDGFSVKSLQVQTRS